ncbi:glucosyltransferase domain-containing protein [uncultured Ruegeria sp.]|uniref:glucosyltransferase domain-containing protein n=1 Tax=uncultured Ruegeria sp. TaxID=259304 RepID=UPI0026364786|nr:glucosyltransferase domain-containing protein [uncultured Ruegeria sp.]
MNPAHSAYTLLTKCRWPHAISASLLIYMITTVPGLIRDGRNPDDWRQVHGAPEGGLPLNWTTEEGRWAMEVLYVHVFLERFLPVLQAGLAAVAFLLLSWILARQSSDRDNRPFATFLIFTLGVHHIYMINALTFSSHVFAFPLALLLSVAGFKCFERSILHAFGARVIWILIGAQCIALCAALYQPFVPFGAVILFLSMIRISRYETKDTGKLILFSAIGSCFGILIYLGQAHLAAQLYDHIPTTNRVTMASTNELEGKLRDAPQLLGQIWRGSLQRIPWAIKTLNTAYIGIGFLLAIGLSALVFLSSPQNWLRALRILAGAAGILLLPLLIWLVYDGQWLPSRAVAYVGLLAAVFYLAVDTEIRARGFTAPIILGLPLIVALTYAFMAPFVWSDQSEMGDRDEALAEKIMARVAELEGYDGAPFRIVGHTDYPDLAWGDMIGWTVFHAGNSRPGIFKDMFDLDWYAEGGLYEGPQACDAFPAADSVYLHQDAAYVCLSQSPGFSRDLMCADSDNTEIGRICITQTAILRFSKLCAPPIRGNRINILRTDSPAHRAAFYDVQSRGHTILGGCFYTAGWSGEVPNEIDVSVTTKDGILTWSEKLTLTPKNYPFEITK